MSTVYNIVKVTSAELGSKSKHESPTVKESQHYINLANAV